ncbi:hypothetical protein Tco_0228001 [Tanacetum coccineum]
MIYEKLNGKETVENDAQIPIATIVALDIFKLDLDPLAPRLLQNMETHVYYLKHTQEQADILRGIVKQTKAKQPLDNELDLAFETPKPETKVYSRRPKQIKLVGSSKNAKIIKSKIANNSEPNHLWGSNATDVPSSSSLVNDSKFLGTVRFRNDQVAKIMGYGNYLLGNIIISRDPDTQICTQSLDDMLKTFPICLLSKASKTKSWLWHHQLSYLNFGKSKKSSHQPKAEDTNQEKLYLLHMDLCGPMRMESINGKKHILVIVDDYS